MAFTFLGLALIVACSAPPLEEVQGDADEALTSSDCPNTVPSGVTCDEQTVLSAVSGPRADVLNRGFGWLHESPPIAYSQSSNPATFRDGYRTDCSGFVSMSWQTGTSFNTALFIGGQGKDTVLASSPGNYSALVPGDGLVYHNSSIGHTLLFAGWANDAHTVACIVQNGGTPLRDARGQSQIGSNMKFGTASTSYLKCKGFVPIRSTALPAAASGGTTTPGVPPQKPCPNPDPALTPTADQIACADNSCGFDTSHACVNPSDCCSNVCADNGSGQTECGSASQNNVSTTSTAAPGRCNREGGYYCGNPASNLKGDPNILYHCEQNKMVLVQSCAGGCTVNGTGIDDQCASVDPGSSGSSSSSGGTGNLACSPAGLPCLGPDDVCCDDEFGLPQSCLVDPTEPADEANYVCQPL